MLQIKTFSPILFLNILLFLFFTSCTQQDNSQWIETIENDKITTDRIKRAFDTEIEYLSRQQSIEKNNLIEIINKDVDELEDQLKPIHQKFQKKNFYNTYKSMLIVKNAAEKTGFSNRPDIKDIIEYVRTQTISQLYLQEEIEKRIKISDEDANKECQNLRNKDPRFKVLTIDKCIMVARGYLKNELSNREFQYTLDKIKERLVYKTNDKFDIDEYLKNESDLKGAKTSTKPSN
jgi:hypothetical protein